MLTEMARMSLYDGLVMQIHPGSMRSHNPSIHKTFGRDKGADIPTPTDYVRALKPLLDRFGNDRRLSLIVFTLDESSYARELAPLAGHYPALKLGPSWWFHDSPEGMRRLRERVTETAGFCFWSPPSTILIGSRWRRSTPFSRRRSDGTTRAMVGSGSPSSWDTRS